MTTPRILVALATYNEIENLPGLTEAILRVLPTAGLLVVDDNSPDGSGRWCDEQAVGEPRLRCLHRPGKLGLGSATLDAIRYAIAHEYDLVVTMDADWSHDPVHLPELVAATEIADVAIGSRYIAGSAIDGWPRHRRIMSRLINGLSRTLLQLPIHDTSGASAPIEWPNCASSNSITSGQPAMPTWKKSSGTWTGQTPASPRCRSRFTSAAPAAQRSISVKQREKWRRWSDFQ